eukprot:1161105-Pelagomonas_calceolata.AAC.10
MSALQLMRNLGMRTLNVCGLQGVFRRHHHVYDIQAALTHANCVLLLLAVPNASFQVEVMTAFGHPCVLCLHCSACMRREQQRFKRIV